MSRTRLAIAIVAIVLMTGWWAVKVGPDDDTPRTVVTTGGGRWTPAAIPGVRRADRRYPRRRDRLVRHAARTALLAGWSRDIYAS